ncbi:MAG: hypothetical protein H8E91_01295 [Planctomycetes bacterium]|nr:hypothetical protein [Planctomycetota bacterium]
MRFVIEHPWASGCILSSISFALIWTGLRDGKSMRVKFGLATITLAIAAMIIGNIYSTPREHASRVVHGFIDAVMENNISGVRNLVAPNVIVVDDLGGKLQGKIAGVLEGVRYLHDQFPPTSNTILRFEVFEREHDVIVEISMMTRISHIGSIPNRWHLIVTPTVEDVWQITTIDVVEVAFRSYR